MIALLHGAPAFGAVERYVSSIAEGLREAGQPAVLAYPRVEELAPFQELEGDALRLAALPLDLVAGPAPPLVRQLVRLLRRERPRLVHVTDVWPPAILAARLAGVRTILVTHHTPELPRRDNFFGRLWWHLSWLARPTVIYTSEADRRMDGRRLVETLVVPLGIDLERFATIRRPNGGPGPVIGNVARLAPQKGQAMLLRAAPRVLKRFPQARFVIVGEGELRPDLERLARELAITQRIQLVGARDDVPALLETFDVFAFPSLFEGFCLAVIEAQAAGVPVVATPVGGIRETVVEGETGLLVPPRDPDVLAERIVWLLEHPEAAERMANEARARVLDRFSEQRMVERTLALYAERLA